MPKAALAEQAKFEAFLIGELSGSLANPVAIVPVLVTNAIWGGYCGGLVWGIQQISQTQSLWATMEDKLVKTYPLSMLRISKNHRSPKRMPCFLNTSFRKIGLYLK